MPSRDMLFALLCLLFNLIIMLVAYSVVSYLHFLGISAKHIESCLGFAMTM